MTQRTTRADRTAAMKERVRRAASGLFLEKGFAATSVREIAARAGVDPANISRYFGSKEGLFLDVIVPPESIGKLMEGPLETLAQDYVRFLLDAREGEHGAIFAALLRTSERPEVGDALRAHTVSLFTDRLVPRLQGENAPLRAHLFASSLTGLQISLWVAHDHVLLEAETEALIRILAPSLQLLLTPRTVN
jgi:AcrR family transcriptional regulator